jgi:RimJ/RimL family protein N-acetyltransferase
MDVLETERLLLEPWSEARRADFATLAANLRVMRYIGDGSTWALARTNEVFARQLDHWEQNAFGWRAATLKATGAWVGFIGLNYVGPEAVEIDNKDEVEIGWWLKPSVWHQGYAAEGALALRDEAFERIGLDRIIGRHRPANVASGRIMERLGMTFEREAVGRHGEVVRIFALDRVRWLRLRTHQSSDSGG